ncbi:MAG: TPM domain-containing protein [Lachnospiraceae bacterium]|nr:TPM domain-containing protein [Lachnospiraceae bacterium]
MTKKNTMRKAVFTISFCLCFALLCTFALPLASKAKAQHPPRLVDDAGVLGDAEARDLVAQLDEVSYRLAFDIVIVTTEDLGGSNPRNFADVFYVSHGYGFDSARDGVILLISFDGDNEWYIVASGFGYEAFTDAGIQYAGDRMVSSLSAGNFYQAFSIFVDVTEDFVNQARAGTAFVPGSAARAIGITDILLALVIGAVLATVITLGMRGQLKSVRSKTQANDYMRPGSLEIQVSRDTFLYRNVTRRERPRNNSGGGGSFRSSGGGMSRGGGGRF